MGLEPGEIEVRYLGFIRHLIYSLHRVANPDLWW